MFHWICPECGREIPPAVKECPACDPQIVAKSEVSPVNSSPAELPPQPPPLPVAASPAMAQPPALPPSLTLALQGELLPEPTAPGSDAPIQLPLQLAEPEVLHIDAPVEPAITPQLLKADPAILPAEPQVPS